MTYKTDKQRNYLKIDLFAGPLAKRLGANIKKKNWIKRNLWKYYTMIMWWELPNTHNWMIGGTQKLSYNEDHIGYHSVTGFVYLARLLVTYPGFQQYLTKYINEAFYIYAQKDNKVAEIDNDEDESIDETDGNEDTISAVTDDSENTEPAVADDSDDVVEEDAEPYMPDIYYSLWEQTGDEMYLRYLQSLLYVLNKLGKDNLNNDADNLYNASGKNYKEKYYDNVVSYCLLVIEKFENKDFKLNKRYNLNKHIKLNLGFGKYRDKFLTTYNGMRKLENQTLGLAGFLNSSRNLSRWQVTRVSALIQKYQNVLYKLTKNTRRAKEYTLTEKQMDILKEIDRYTQLYAKNFTAKTQLTEQEYQKLKSIADIYNELLTGAKKPDNR